MSALKAVEAVREASGEIALVFTMVDREEGATETFAEAGLPFAAVRVISDPAHRALPALARAAIKPNGQIDLPAVLRGIVRNPTTLHALVSTGIDFNRALRSLRGCRDYLIGTELAGVETLVSKAA